MADAPTQGPPGAATGEYDDGSGIPSGPAFHSGIPEEAFPVPSWGQRLDVNRPASPKIDPNIFQKPDDTTGMDRTMERMPTRMPTERGA